MPTSIYTGRKVADVFAAARTPQIVNVPLPGRAQPVAICKPFRSPTDWRSHWLYEIMVDRFNNAQLPPPGDWNRKRPDDQGRFGGTFEGIRQKLDYLQALGVGALWLTPVLKNRSVPAGGSHHGYGIYDFTEVDQRFGSDPAQPGLAEKELIQLVNDAHARNIYVILDIVLNHAGDLFEYVEPGTQNLKNQLGWSDQPYETRWRDDATGSARPDWAEPPPTGTSVGPTELLTNRYFRRKGAGGMEDWCQEGDFCTLKEFHTDFTDEVRDKPVWNILIRAHQYLIALLDVDGFRVDTFKFIEEEFARTFCNAVREFAYSLGKENFFIFGEAKTSAEDVLARYTGRNSDLGSGDQIGADAQLDFPVCWKLGNAVKGFEPVRVVQELFANRREAQKKVLSTHGEASKFFVTFLDCHDDHNRFLYPRDGKNYDDQLTLALGCLFSLQGIPCLYYGTENGLNGTVEIYASSYDGTTGCPEFVREAFWGKPQAFDTTCSLFTTISKLATVRRQHPALEFGRQYFREVSGNDADFGFSKDKSGLLAFSRLLNDREVVVVANTNLSQSFSGQVLVDDRINAGVTSFSVGFSNKGTTGTGAVARGFVNFYDDGSFRGNGWACRVPVVLAPSEVQILVQDL